MSFTAAIVQQLALHGVSGLYEVNFYFATQLIGCGGAAGFARRTGLSSVLAESLFHRVYADETVFRLWLQEIADTAESTAASFAAPARALPARLAAAGVCNLAAALRWWTEILAGTELLTPLPDGLLGEMLEIRLRRLVGVDGSSP
jgi:hypothetical protein